jgi:protein-disulfide isomerase
MAKKVRRTRRRQRASERGTDWRIIGGVIALAAVALIALLAVSLSAQDSAPTPTVAGQPLVDYCQENPENCVAKGPADAPVTVVEVSDYGCGHCRNFNLDTAGLLEDLYVTPGQVRWVILPYALSQQTLPAAEAAMCAGDQERFWEFHHRMFEIQNESLALSRRGFMDAAEDLGLDTDAFDECLDSAKYRPLVASNIDAAERVGVRATPTFFFNDQMLEGNAPLSTFQQRINALLGTANAG